MVIALWNFLCGRISRVLYLFQNNNSCGMTLIEIIIVAAIIGTITGVALPTYTSHMNKVNNQQAVADMLNIELCIEKFYAENGRYPDNLAEIGKDGLEDPWEQTYQYLNMANDPKQNECRKIRNIHPINTDYDLYSVGKDGKSTKSINSEVSWDDVIRAYDGSYMGVAKDII